MLLNILKQKIKQVIKKKTLASKITKRERQKINESSTYKGIIYMPMKTIPHLMRSSIYGLRIIG